MTTDSSTHEREFSMVNCNLVLLFIAIFIILTKFLYPCTVSHINQEVTPLLNQGWLHVHRIKTIIQKCLGISYQHVNTNIRIINCLFFHILHITSWLSRSPSSHCISLNLGKTKLSIQFIIFLKFLYDISFFNSIMDEHIHIHPNKLY